MNWLNRVGTTETLTGKKYLKIKNFNVERVHLIDLNQKVQRNGLYWPTAPKADHVFPKTPSQTAKTFKGTGTLTLKQVPHLTDEESGISDGSLANTNKIIGIAIHPRALGMAAWTIFANNEFAGVPIGAVQMSYFTDPLTGFPFRLDLWYDPDLQKYKMRCLARFGFSNINWRDATLLFKA